VTNQKRTKVFRCTDCRRRLVVDVAMAPMLHDRAWRRLAREDETLCAGCMFKRAAARHVKLTLAHLRPCPFNLGGAEAMTCWFNRFARDAQPTAKALEEWRGALRFMYAKLLRRTWERVP
jgi:hypothetical protein